jgi:hypothetical protein
MMLSILTAVEIQNEIQGWQLFSSSLRQANRLLFEKMMSELDPEMLSKASLAKDPFEVILMALVFQRQKMIMELMEQIKKG